MASQYRSINGIKYERDLLNYAEKQDGRSMTKADADTLWENAMDGNKVTPTERRTLEYIMENFNMNDAAKTHLKAKLAGKDAEPKVQRKGSSYYKSIAGVQYDRELLEEAERRAAQRGGRLRFEDALHLWGKANDGPGVTPTEKRTLQYVGQQYRLEAEARQFLEKSLGIKIVPSLTNGGEDQPGFLKSIWNRITGQPSTDEKPQQQQHALQDDVPGAKRQRKDGPASSGPSGARALEDASNPDVPAAKRKRMDGPASADARPASSALQDSSAAEADLCPELRELLAKMSGDGAMLQLEYPEAPAPPVDAELVAQKAKASAEVERILKARSAEEVLGAGSKEDQRREFKRLALLLHPDKGLVEHDDARASLAMRLVQAALSRSRQGS